MKWRRLHVIAINGALEYVESHSRRDENVGNNCLSWGGSLRVPILDIIFAACAALFQ